MFRAIFGHLFIVHAQKTATLLLLVQHLTLELSSPCQISNRNLHFGNWATFAATFSQFSTVHVQKRPHMYFRLKIWCHIWAPCARFLIECVILAITRCLGQLLLCCLLHKTGHFSTSGQILNCKFEIPVDRFLFDYEIWWHLHQDLCMFGAKNVLCNAKLSNFEH